MQKTIIQIITIASVSVILGFGRFFLMGDQYSLIKEKRILNTLKDESTNPNNSCSLPDILSEPMLIDLDFASCLFNNGDAIFIDARAPEDFKQSHIRNSINIPFDYWDDYIYQIEATDKETVLVIYCSGGECSLSIDLADQLFFEEGFFNVLVFEGGFPSWKEKGYPVN